MSLTLAQKQALKADMLANTTQLPFSGGLATIAAVFGAASLDAGDATLIADHYNGEAVPTFYGFPDTVSVQSIIGATVGQNFGEWLALAANAATTNLHHNALDLVLRNGTIHPQDPETRNALSAIFPTGTAPNSRAAVLDACSRHASYAEKVLSAVGTGPGGGNGSAMNQSALLNWEGSLTTNDVQDLWGVPSA